MAPTELEETMASIVGSKTELNLLLAFAGESQARNRYDFFSSKAKSDGYVQIAKLFRETAEQEKEHGERFFKFLEGGHAKISAPFPAGEILSTEENLLAAAAGEREEWEKAYAEFAKTAEGEGFSAIAAAFRAIAVAEKHHMERFTSMLEELRRGTIFKKSDGIIWECLNCGYLHSGNGAPEICPACAHAKAYFARKRDCWH
jgi:rubrerythrin